MKKLIFIYSMLFSLMVFSQTTIKGFEYWFDNDVGRKKANLLSFPSPLLFVNNTLVTTGLVDGLHVVNIRGWDSNNKFSSITTDFFYKKTLNSKTDKNIVAYEYLLDNDVSVLNSVPSNVNLELNVLLDFSEIQDGLHVFNIRFKDDTGRWSSISTDFFYKKSANSISNKGIVECQYWLDNDFANAVKETVTFTEIFNLNKILNVSSLVDGLHVLHLRFKDNTGRWSSINTDFFYKKSSNSVIDKKVVEYQYWHDNDFANAVNETVSSTEIFNLNKTIDYSSLVDGLHVFNIRFKDDTGRWSSITTDFYFKKQADISPKNIVGYEYWINDDYANVVKSTVTAAPNYTFNSIILPGTLSARYNVLNFRFKDDFGEWSSIISETFEEITLATVENTLKDVTFYPNPFDENLFINLGKNYHKIEVQVFDGSGRKVYHEEFSNKNLLELRLKLNSGVYQLVLKADDKVTSRKILRR